VNAAIVDELVRLRAIEREYRTTVNVLAVVVERLLAATHATRIEITDAAYKDSPDLHAWREETTRLVVLTTAR
jgi:hypothetical protein